MVQHDPGVRHFMLSTIYWCVCLKEMPISHLHCMDVKRFPAVCVTPESVSSTTASTLFGPWWQLVVTGHLTALKQLCVGFSSDFRSLSPANDLSDAVVQKQQQLICCSSLSSYLHIHSWYKVSQNTRMSFQDYSAQLSHSAPL